MRALRFLVLSLPLACTTAAPRPATTSPAAMTPPAPAAKVPGAEGRADPVAVDLSEVRITVDEKGNAVEERHDIYRVLSGDPPEAWSSVYAGWEPWSDEPPALDAVVVRPDGTTTKLDPKTVVDEPEPRDDGILSDGKLRMAPLPGLAPGVVVDRHVRKVHHAEIVAGWSQGLGLDTDVATRKKRIVIDVPQGTPLASAVLHSDVALTREEKGGRVILEWERAPALPGPDVPDLAPPEERTWPVLRVSTVPSWQAVAQAWSARAAQQIDVDAVKPVAREVTKNAAGRDEKAKAVLAWLRKNVRYTGLELGESAWVPHTSAQVLERKFGDCKDLALLAVALLRAVDVDADVALVRSTGIDVLPEVPGLSGFDHAIVHVAAAGGLPDVWLDATNPLLAYGEMNASLIGRRALLARPDTTGLTEIVSRGTSHLETQVTTTMSEGGPARFERTRDSDGWLFSSSRDVAMRNHEEYEKNLRAWAKDAHKATSSPAIACGDPFAAAPFHEALTVNESSFGVVDGISADAILVDDQLFNPIGDVTQLDDDGALASRTSPLYLPMSADARVVNHVVPPPGYRMEALPEDVDEHIGPVAVGVHWARAGGDAVDATLTLQEAPGRLTADEARKLAALVERVRGTHVAFKSVVFTALGQQRFVTAVRAAKSVASGGAGHALVAYALASAGLVELARTEAEEALKAAPGDALARDRAAYVYMLDDDGVELRKGFRRKRVLEIAGGTIAAHPDDEWAQRLYVLAAARNENGDYLGPGVDLADVAARALAYRDKTGSTGLDDVLIDALAVGGDWAKLAAAAAKMAKSDRRDAAWLAADVAATGAAKAIERALHDGRYQDAAISAAAQMLTMTRAYPAAADLMRAAAARNGRTAAVQPYLAMLEHMQRCRFTAGDRSEPVLHLANGLVNDDDAELALAFDGLDAAGRRAFADGARAMWRGTAQGGLPGGGLICDLIQSITTAKAEPLAPYGDLVTLEPQVPGMLPPMSVVLVKHGDGWRISGDAARRLAVDGLDAIDRGDAARAEVLFRALQRLEDDAAVRSAAEHGEWTTTVPLWAARVAAADPVTRARGLAFLRKHAGQVTTGPQTAFVAGALLTGAKDDPAVFVDVGRALAASRAAEVHRAGVRLELVGLRRAGRFAEAKERVAAERKKMPDDTALQSAEMEVAADLGDVRNARALAATRAAATADKAAAADLWNEAAWLSIYDRPDDEAQQQAERAVQQQANAARLNTLAVVDAELGRFDEAAAAFHRELAAHPAGAAGFASVDAYLVGRLAEELGYLDAAKAAYAKVEKRKDGSADDLWRLAQPRLKRLAHTR